MRYLYNKIAAAINHLFPVPPTEVGKNNEDSRVAWIERTIGLIPEGTTILDAGAGECQFKHLCDHLKYTSQDFNQYDGKGDGSGLQTKEWDTNRIDIVSDITSIPVASESFGAVLCTEVLEHVPDPVAALKELDRILMKEGFIVITAPFASLTHFSPYHFSTGFNKYFYTKWLEDMDYEILDIQSNGNYFEYLAQETRRLSKISREYADYQFNAKDFRTIFKTLRLLDAVNKLQSGSEELLCFGYHLFAKKK